MITFGTPAFLLAGALAALVPLALHLIRRRPPTRAPLPTARFLSDDPRTSIRVSRPTDLLLLALRMLLLVLVGAAFARPAWLPAPEGTSEIVLLDRSAPMAGAAWRPAVDAARRALIGPDGRARGELVLFGREPVRVPRAALTPGLFDTLSAGPDSAADLAAALRGLRAVAHELRGADSVRVTLLSGLRAGAWTPGVAALRRAAWPGSIAVPTLPVGADSARATTSSSPRRAVVVAPANGGGYASAALAATGWEVRTLRPADAIPADASLYLFLAAPSAIPDLAGTAATVVADAGAGPDLVRGVAAWTGAGPLRADQGGALWIGDEVELAGAAGRAPGGPAEGARVIAAWDDGRPAAAAKAAGRACAVYVATALEGGEMPLTAAYPRALDRLARGCDAASSSAADARPLDAGARALLAGRGPATVAASVVAGPGGGTALGRWLLGAAILVALIETGLAYRRRMG